nr:hypothetical protein [Oligoflexales bacterium]
DEFHIYEYTMGEMVMKVKVRKVTDEDGFLKGAEMMTCSAGKQSEYTKWDFSGEEVAILSKGVSEPDNEEVESVSYEYSISATGVDEDGVLSGEKEISLRYQNLFTDGGNNHVISTAKQTAEKIEIMRAACEKESLTAECATHSESLYVSADLINNNPEGSQSPNFLALGDGAAFIKSEEIEGVQQWLADSGLVDNEAESTHGTYVLEKSGEIVEISSEHEAVEFAEEESWDCSGDATAAQFAEALLPICGAYSLDQNVHLECNQASLSKSVITE